MTGLMSAADERGLDWLTRWVGLGCNLTNDHEGHLVLIPPPSCTEPSVAAEITGMRNSIMSDPLLAHAVGRALLNYYRWENAGGGAGD
jgi:hypothetical protein